MGGTFWVMGFGQGSAAVVVAIMFAALPAMSPARSEAATEIQQREIVGTLGFAPRGALGDVGSGHILYIDDDDIALVSSNGDVLASSHLAEPVRSFRLTGGAFFGIAESGSTVYEVDAADGSVVERSFGLKVADVAATPERIYLLHGLGERPDRISYVPRAGGAVVPDVITSLARPGGGIRLLTAELLSIDLMTTGDRLLVATNVVATDPIAAYFEPSGPGVVQGVTVATELSLAAPVPNENLLIHFGTLYDATSLTAVGPTAGGAAASFSRRDGVTYLSAAADGGGTTIVELPSGTVRYVIEEAPGPLTPDGTAFLGIQGRTILREPFDFGPRLTGTTTDVVDLDRGMIVGLEGYALDTVTSARLEGVGSALEVVRSTADRLAVRIPPTRWARATARIVVMNDAGSESSIDVPVGQGDLYISVERTAGPRSDEAVLVRAVCQPFDTTAPSPASRQVGNIGEEHALLVEGRCRTEVLGGTGPSVGDSQRGFLGQTASRSHPFAESGPDTFEDGVVSEHRVVPVGVRLLLDYRSADRVLWVGADGSGEPGQQRYPMVVRCGSMTSRITVARGSMDRLRVPAGQPCTIRLRSTQGGAHPRVTVLENDNVVRTVEGRSVTFDGTFALFSLDYPETPLQHPALIGSPDASVKGRTGAGEVTLFDLDAQGYPSPEHARVVHQGSLVGDRPQPGDAFGASTSQADVDGDGWVDLIVGAPGEDLGRRRDAGVVHVIYGGPNGPERRADIIRLRGRLGLAAPRSGDRLGAAVAAIDFNRDGYVDVVAGMPGRDLGRQRDVGQVVVFYGDPRGLGTEVEILRIGDEFLRRRSRAGDEFGAALESNGRLLLIGAPGATVQRRRAAGVIKVLLPNFFQTSIFDQTRFTATPPERDARFGEVMDHDEDLFSFGLPRLDNPGAPDSGGVLIARIDEPYFIGGAFPIMAPAADGVAPAPGDRFGASVSVLRVGPGSAAGPDFIIFVGAPGVDVDGRADAGRAFAYRSVDGRLVFTDRSLSGVPGEATSGDLFGESMKLVGFGRSWLIGVPGFDGPRTDIGAVFAYGEEVRVVTRRSLVSVASGAGDAFGSILDGRRLATPAFVDTVPGGERRLAVVGPLASFLSTLEPL